MSRFDLSIVSEDDSSPMQINLEHPSAQSFNYRALMMHQHAAQPLSPSNQALHIPTADPVVYRGTAVDLDSFAAPQPHAFSVAGWDNESDGDNLMHGKELKLSSIMDTHAFVPFQSSAASKIELPTIEVSSSVSPKYIRELSSPPPLNQIDLSFTFTSYVSSTILLNGLCDLLASNTVAQSMTVKVHERYSSIEGRLVHGHGYVGFSLNLFSHPLLPSSILVEVQRRSGDYAVFVDFYQKLIKNVQQCGWFADYFDNNHHVMAPVQAFGVPSMGFDDFDEDALDALVMKDFIKPAHAVTAPCPSKQDREYFDLALSLTQAQSMAETDSLAFIQHGLTSYDDQQKIQSLDLIQLLISQPQAPVQSQSLLPIIVSAIEAVHISTSLQSLFFMRELTRTLLMLVSMLTSSSDGAELSAKLSSKASEWAPMDSVVASQLGSAVQRIATINQN